MDMTATGTREGGRTMAGTFLIKITRASGEIHDLRYRYMWSAWLDGTLLGSGHCFKPEDGIARAHDLVSPDEVEHIEIISPTP
jgi:hypothetical protein